MKTDYQQWLETLNAGDEIRVRFIWDDGEVPGGRSVPATVLEVNPPESRHWRWKVQYDRHGDGKQQTKCIYQRGSNGYEQIIPSDLGIRVVSGEHGYYFLKSAPPVDSGEEKS